MALFRNRPSVPESSTTPPRPRTTPPSVQPLPTPAAQPSSQSLVCIGEEVDGHGYTLPPEFPQIREEVQRYLVNEVKSLNGGSERAAEIRRLVEPVYANALARANLVLSRAEREKLLEMILADILGYGPIQPLLDRDDITEVMVNGPYQVYVERNGKLCLTDVKFIDDKHVMYIIERIVAPLGRRIDEASPMVDGRLPDGSRVNAIIPPLSLNGPVLTIRKFRREPFTINDLIRFGTLTPEVAQFLEAAVVARLNIIVSGGTGSGKTTLLNVLSSFIPANERVITIEDAAELQLRQPHVVRLEKRPPNIEGKGGVSIRDLVINSLRMRPDRIVVGEVRGGEALDMLQAMNTGHDGSLTTVHSNSPRDTLSRIETMVLMAGFDMPVRAIRQQIASAIDLIVHVERMRDGVRRIVQIAEITGMEGDMIVMQDIFVFKQEGFDETGRIRGQIQPTGLRPRVSDEIERVGIVLPPNIFGQERFAPAWRR